jgi:hypothetical protein
MDEITVEHLDEVALGRLPRSPAWVLIAFSTPPQPLGGAEE